MAHLWTPRFRGSLLLWLVLKSESTLERWLPRPGRDKVLLQFLRRKQRMDPLKPTRLNKTRIAMDDIVHSPHTSTHHPADGID
jgi:hypothetical protein